MSKNDDLKIGVVIPCFKVSSHILEVVMAIGSEVSRIYVVDDFCPEFSGEIALKSGDNRLSVIRHISNVGVGGAVMTGYQVAMDDGMDIIVKIDGDGQMDPSEIKNLISPILAGRADYTKGNRFFNPDQLRGMPKVRIFGNAILSFMTKFSSGYWDIFDPTNGFTAIHSNIAKLLPFKKISSRYFFETDILFRLNLLRATVIDVPMSARYANEKSNLKISKVIGEFLVKHIRNFIKRIFYNYYLRDMSVASIELPLGFGLSVFGILFGLYHWVKSALDESATPVGTVMLSAISVTLGIQFILAFLAYDIASVPRSSRQLTNFKE